MPTDPVIWGLGSALLALVSAIIYLVSILRGHTKPHVFTWVIWSLLTSIAFVIQYVEGAGSGSWATGVAAVFCIITTLSCYWKGEKRITRFDWAVFVLSTTAIPLWLVTKNPTWSIILVTAIDVAAYLPTIRKSWSKPYEEMTFTTNISTAKHIVSLMAMEQFKLTTVLYPAALIVANMVLVGAIYLRRYIYKP